ncbi:hypothetical protein MTO96_013453 [Rhipicephalus appendiculatus]
MGPFPLFVPAVREDSRQRNPGGISGAGCLVEGAGARIATANAAAPPLHVLGVTQAPKRAHPRLRMLYAKAQLVWQAPEWSGRGDLLAFTKDLSH